MAPPPLSIPASFLKLYGDSPAKSLFTFVDEDGRDQRTLTVGELAGAADAIARMLHDRGLAPGDRALLVYPPSLDFIKAFFGCMAAGVIPVPVYPPSPFRLRSDLAAFRHIVESSGATAALTNGEYDRARLVSSVRGLFDHTGPRWPKLAWHRTDRHTSPASGLSSWHEPALDDVAFLQYSSGSTGNPKGVMVTHGNLAHEIAANVVDLRLDLETRGVFWIPQYHDMGLINVILSTSLGNSHSYLMSPLTFLRQPTVWLDVMSRTRATITAAPNFAYELAVRRTTPEMRRSWDLSELRMAISAAEPVSPATVQAFVDAFEASGMRRDVVHVAYGMAENTASITNCGRSMVRLDKEALADGEVVRLGDGPSARPSVTYAGCGHSSKPGDRIRIVDPGTGVPCAPDRVGEIWVRSSTTAAGYFGMEELSREVFHATVTGDDTDTTHYLRTGDLGFLLDGELYVTGRIKDLIIVRGRNVYPTDLEESARDCHALVRPGGLAAFSVTEDEDPYDGAPDDGAERIVIMVETREKKLAGEVAEEICQAVRKRIYEDHQLDCHAVVLGRAGLVKKTTSGKVRRRICKAAYTSGDIRRAPETILLSLVGERL